MQVDGVDVGVTGISIVPEMEGKDYKVNGLFYGQG